MDTIIIVTWIANNLIPSHLWSRWNVGRGVFLVTWSLIFLLSVEQLVLTSINISTSWVDWRSLVTPLSSSWWLSGAGLDVLVAWDNPGGWQVSVSCLALVVVSLGWYLRARFNGWLDSQVSLALKSRLWCFTKVFLTQFVEKKQSVESIIANGHHPHDVNKITSLILRNEYKRRQSAPGPKVSNNAFGKERRYPMTSKFKP